MAKGIEGKFCAVVKEVTLEKVGKNDSPVVRVSLQPYAEYVGNDVQAKPSMRMENKMYFLSMDIQTVGKHAGKSGIEATKLDLEAHYGYTGNLDPQVMNAAMVEKQVDIVCELNKDGWTRVKYVNPRGGVGSKPRKDIKLLDAVDIKAFASVWNGAKTESAVSASDLFSKLVAGAKKEEEVKNEPSTV